MPHSLKKQLGILPHIGPAGMGEMYRARGAKLDREMPRLGSQRDG